MRFFQQEREDVAVHAAERLLRLRGQYVPVEVVVPGVGAARVFEVAGDVLAVVRGEQQIGGQSVGAAAFQIVVEAGGLSPETPGRAVDQVGMRFQFHVLFRVEVQPAVHVGLDHQRIEAEFRGVFAPVERGHSGQRSDQQDRLAVLGDHSVADGEGSRRVVRRERRFTERPGAVCGQLRFERVEQTFHIGQLGEGDAELFLPVEVVGDEVVQEQLRGGPGHFGQLRGNAGFAQ